MAKRRKIRYDRLILLVLAFLVVLFLIGFGVSRLLSWMTSKNNGAAVPQTVDPLPVETASDTKVELLDYQVYADESKELEFSFIIANMRFTSQGPVSFDLSNLQTSEKIYLNKVSSYLQELESRNYDLSKLKIIDSVVSKDNEYTCNIFIPFKTDSSSLRLLNSLDASKIDFDLDHGRTDISSLIMGDDQQIEVGDSNISVSSCSISTMMLHNGEEYQIPSTLNVYTFRIHVEKAEGDLRITDARFISASGSDPVECMSEEYESVKAANCLNKKLVTGDNGALFFETGSSGTPDYSGHLMLKFANESEWVKIPTVLE